MPTAPDKGLSGANHVAYFVTSTRSLTTCRTSWQMCSTLLGRSWSVQLCCSSTDFPSFTISTTMSDPQHRTTTLLYLSILNVSIYNVLSTHCQLKFHISFAFLHFQYPLDFCIN